MTARRLAPAVGALWVLLTPAAPRAAGLTGAVEIRVTDHRPAIADFAALRVRIEAVDLHPAEAPRRQGWLELPVDAGVVPDLVPLKDGRSAEILTAQVPARGYDAVRVRFGSVHGTLTTGVTTAVTPQPSTVAVQLRVTPDRAAVVVIDLVVEDQSDHPGQGYVLKVRDVAVR